MSNVVNLDPNDQPPRMLLEVTDWLTGEDVSTMTFEEKGVYIDLIAISWAKLGIPSDPRKVQRLLRLSDDEFARVWPVVGEKFTERDDRLPGRLYNDRVEMERQIFYEKQAKQSTAGRKAANSRWQKRTAA